MYYKQHIIIYLFLNKKFGWSNIVNWTVKKIKKNKFVHAVLLATLDGRLEKMDNWKKKKLISPKEDLTHGSLDRNETLEFFNILATYLKNYNRSMWRQAQHLIWSLKKKKTQGPLQRGWPEEEGK